MRAAAEKDALIGLWFVGQKYYPKDMVAWIDELDYVVFEETRNWLVAYFSTQGQALPEMNLRPKGSAFQMTVWKALLNISCGQTMTYGAIAEGMMLRGGFVSAQAVGHAVGRNPISLLIPCHRVIGFNGSLTGYAGGIEKKRTLLEFEHGYRQELLLSTGQSLQGKA
jgi:methylated-DNA-[protein]-cysteine S-methyltransferase